MSDLSPDSGPHIDQVTWFDGHCHFDFPVLDDTRDSDWAMAQRGGVTGGILPAVSYQCSAHLADFAAAYNGWYFAAGLHPYWIHEHKPQHLNWLSGQLSTPRCVAVGECGLDRTLAKQGGASLELQWFWLMHNSILPRPTVCRWYCMFAVCTTNWLQSCVVGVFRMEVWFTPSVAACSRRKSGMTLGSVSALAVR